MNKLDIQHNMLQNYYHTASLPMFHKKSGSRLSSSKMGKSVDDLMIHRLKGKFLNSYFREHLQFYNEYYSLNLVMSEILKHYSVYKFTIFVRFKPSTKHQ